MNQPPLFRPNNLSQATKYAPVDGSCQDIISGLAAAWFPGDQLIFAQRIVHDDPEASHFRVKIGPRAVFMKSRLTKEADLMQRETAIADWLSSRNALTPKLFRLPDGALLQEQDGLVWCALDFVEGSGFIGGDAQLISASRALARLTSITAEFRGNWPQFEPALPKLRQLCGFMERFIDQRAPAWEAVEQRQSVITQAVKNLEDYIPVLEADIVVTHSDFHPRNVVVAHDQVCAILDFEDVRPYPRIAAVGFGAFKMIRQAVAHAGDDPQVGDFPRLVKLWLRGWHDFFPEDKLSALKLETGARYVVLQLVNSILLDWLTHNSSRYLADLEKQLTSLDEIDVIFQQKELMHD
jgi:Ser/Thr protein kinase RdoA (MazF antagonist)